MLQMYISEILFFYLHCCCDMSLMVGPYYTLPSLKNGYSEVAESCASTVCIERYFLYVFLHQLQHNT